MNSESIGFKVEKLEWSDEDLGTLALPKAPMTLRASFGSGLSVRTDDRQQRIWAVGDRGPNLKVETLVERYGVETFEKYQELSGAKIMPRLDLGPQIAELRIMNRRVELVGVQRILDDKGKPVSGLPVPAGAHVRCEPALDLQGRLLPPDPSGLDTEGIAALSDGGFWVGDEFGPSLVRLHESGRVLARHVPEGVELAGAAYPARQSLPALAAKRHLNRGFEAMALSSDEQWLFLAFQSPLAHPDEAAHEAARHVRIWKLHAHSLQVAAQFLYRFDPPETFARDREKGPLKLGDLKLSELACLPGGDLLLLERGSETTKIYRCAVDDALAVAPEFLDIGHRPTIEELSASDGFNLPELPKQLIFTSDQAPEVAADLEGMVILSPRELLLVNDNDFGVEGAVTSFWKIRFDHPVFG